MTGQRADEVLFEQRRYDLVAADGAGLFDPQEHGITPAPIASDCHRGYRCIYTVAGDELRLDRVVIGLDRPSSLRTRYAQGPQLFGRSGHLIESPPGQHVPDAGYFLYDNLHAPILFSGRLLLADGFIRELYVHMGFQPAWKYRTVHGLVFEAGTLLQTTDRSAEFAALRQQQTGPAARYDQSS